MKKSLGLRRNDAIFYTKIRMFDSPAFTRLPVHPRYRSDADETVAELPVGTKIESPPCPTSERNKLSVRSYGRQRNVVPERELLVALCDGVRSFHGTQRPLDWLLCRGGAFGVDATGAAGRPAHLRSEIADAARN